MFIAPSILMDDPFLREQELTIVPPWYFNIVRSIFWCRFKDHKLFIEIAKCAEKCLREASKYGEVSYHCSYSITATCVSFFPSFESIHVDNRYAEVLVLLTVIMVFLKIWWVRRRPRFWFSLPFFVYVFFIYTNKISLIFSYLIVNGRTFPYPNGGL